MKNEESRKELKICSKAYKVAMNKAFDDYQFKVEKDLRTAANSEPRELWRILNNLNNSTSQNEGINLEDLYEYFKNLNVDYNQSGDDENFILPDCNDEQVNNILNGDITPAEILTAIKNLKNNKSPGYDMIMNEYIKTTSNELLPLYTDLFNIILNSGVIPSIWTAGIILPIYKNKVSPQDPDSYRGITLVSSLGKLFTMVLNNRLSQFADLVEIIPKAQAGFRKGYSTLDNIFVLHVLIQLYLYNNKKLYCAFIDFKKAFDTVWRVGLWKKLINCNVTGKILKVIFNMYGNIKSCVKKGSNFSDFFPCDVGVRQGENLYPFLFSIFLSDLETFFIENNISGLQTVSQKI